MAAVNLIENNKQFHVHTLYSIQVESVHFLGYTFNYIIYTEDMQFTLHVAGK